MPWFLLWGVAAGVFLLVRRRHEIIPADDRRGVLPALLLLTALTWLLRGAILGPDFLHQNGQGPLWVRFALCMPSSYGPGYRELFGRAITAFGGEPSAALFTLQEAFAVLTPALGWLLARGVGARGSVPWALALLLACDPTLVRMAQSESYTGPIFVLLLASGALLSWGLRERRLWTVDAVAGATAAGLLIAQAARIHPVAWLPAALIPLVVLVGVPAIDGRWKGWLWATAAVGAVASVGALPVLTSVAGGELGQAMIPTLFEQARWGLLEWRKLYVE